MLSLLVSTVLTATPIPLPGPAPISIDCLAYDAVTHRVWVPAGNTGNVDVVDVKTHAACATIDGMPDGVVHVKARHELWITTPREQRLTIIDANALSSPAARIATPGEPEGYAVDEAGGRFFTNLEDKDRTLVIDTKTRAITATYEPACGEAGPRGLAFDGKRQLLVVACTDGAVTLDLKNGGKVLGRIKVGAGVDNLDLYAKDSLVYLASGATGTLTIAKLADDGTMSVFATAATSPGARNAIVDENGTAYVADGRGGRLLEVKLK